MKKLLFLFLISSPISRSEAQKLHTMEFNSVEETMRFFSYHNLLTYGPIISGHRGGASQQFPENSFALFEETLQSTPAVFEIDVRLTKDGYAVLLHDDTLGRTTTGIGKIIDYTLAELQQLKRKDQKGMVTDIGLVTLQEAIEWSRGKTLINLDVKDVPMEKKIELVTKNNAFSHVIFTVHSPEEARFFYDYDSRSMFSAFIKTKKAFYSYDKSGIPWENILIAYVGPWNKPENEELYDLLHDKGVRVMVSAATYYDKLQDPEERAAAYRKIIKDGADILESDRPIEAAIAIRSLMKN